MKKIFSSYKNYVCPRCFQQLNKCECEIFPPYTLLFIDERIQEHVRILNRKGYLTTGCCEGHYKSYSTEPYVSFGNVYDGFSTIPEGFYYKKSKRMVLAKIINASSEEEFEIKKKELLDNLLDWINKLDDNEDYYQRRTRFGEMQNKEQDK